MNDILHNIAGRRSIRSFKNIQIKDEELSSILDAGIAAPSSMNRQPWHFTVVQDKAFLDWAVQKNREIVLASPELMKAAPWINAPGYNNFYSAPSVVIISGDERNIWHVCDCALAMENMALAAWSLRIGSCIVASVRFVFKEPEFTGKLSLPEGFVPLYALALGYIEGAAPQASERNRDCVNYVK